MPLARRALPALAVAIVLMGAALAVTAWLTHAGVMSASDALVRGQADVFQRDLRNRLITFGDPLGDEALAELLDDHQADGLRFVAALGPRGQVVAKAGAPGEADSARAWAAQASDSVERVGERVRVIFRGPPRHGARRAFFHRRAEDRQLVEGQWPQALLVEFEPVQAEALRTSARRTLGVGAVAAGTLLLLALGLVRWSMRAAAVERERERERRLANLGQLSAVLAHEIRNPLASLKGNAQLLAAMLPEGERPRAKAERVVGEALRLEGLTNDLLEFARDGELHLESVDPATLLVDSAVRISPAIHVVTDGAPRAWQLDPRRVGQVLDNLLDNAVQAGEPVTASVKEEGGRLVYEVRDAGPGVPEVDRARLFDPFFTTRTRGTGLGLAVVKRVVELHRGSVAVEDAPGGGACFRVALPRA